MCGRCVGREVVLGHSATLFCLGCRVFCWSFQTLPGSLAHCWRSRRLAVELPHEDGQICQLHCRCFNVTDLAHTRQVWHVVVAEHKCCGTSSVAFTNARYIVAGGPSCATWSCAPCTVVPQWLRLMRWSQHLRSCACGEWRLLRSASVVRAYSTETVFVWASHLHVDIRAPETSTSSLGINLPGRVPAGC